MEDAPNNQPLVVTLVLDIYNEQTDAIRALLENVCFIKEHIQMLAQQGLHMATSSTLAHSFIEPFGELVPLGSIGELIGFEELLGTSDIRKKFVSSTMFAQVD